MPFKQFISGIAEFGANEVLQLDDEHQTYLQPLSGKSLALTLLPIEQTIQLQFTDSRIDIILPTESDRGLNSDTDLDNDLKSDCHLTIQLSAIAQLRDSNQLTTLIKQDKLDIKGDLSVAQHLSALVNGLDLDLTEILTNKIGDVPAHTIMGTASSVINYAKYVKQHLDITLGEALIEEKQLVASPLALANFSDEVTDTRYWCDRLAARLAILEKQQLAGDK
ncbi:MAG: SCP2 sterol-binding domain-containing protein [Glaciecola sp.]|jgi:ubiquinone biosynthesis protein UbiJ|nr:SCP2 sterol-binding domain-containing protein [Glaciecola sp.]MDG2099285.1 SCP2 sterol-binding domain-containing protein [Glaciecola sp.]